jgi:hypothetical protein
MKGKLYAGLILVIMTSVLFVACSNPETPEPTQTTPGEFTQEESQQIALEFLENSATYKFDGVAETLTLADTLILRCPSCWTFIYKFDSRHGGYGDRTGQMVTQVITPHEAAITVIRGEVTDANLDGKWDMELQLLMATEEESLEIAMEFLKNSPTFKFDGIEGSIKHVDTQEAFCPYCWGFVFEFTCSNGGYGDRTNMAVDTVITPHEAIISISQGKVDGGTIDGIWDMIKQQEITAPEIKTVEHN